jgi:hypothetical protein
MPTVSQRTLLLRRDHVQQGCGPTTCPAAPRDVQIAACHADPRTTMRYDRARKNLDGHPNYVVAAFITSGT